MSKVGVFLLVLMNYSVTAGDTLIGDPSIVPLKTELGVGERYRLLADFNFDGIQDMALSDDTRLFGNGGGEFTLYFGDASGKYRQRGTFFSHPSVDAIAIEKWGETILLWTYSHLGGGVGSLNCQEIGGKDRVTSPQSIIVHPGDSGSAIGNAIVEAVFKNSDAAVNLERSTTREGSVEWK